MKDSEGSSAHIPAFVTTTHLCSTLICIFEVTYKIWNNIQAKRRIGGRREERSHFWEGCLCSLYMYLTKCRRITNKANKKKKKKEKCSQPAEYLCVCVVSGSCSPILSVIESSRRRKQNIFIMSNYVARSPSLFRDLLHALFLSLAIHRSIAYSFT